MKRTAGAFLVAVALGGCMSSGHRPWATTNGCGSCGSKSAAAPALQGPWGQPVTMVAPQAGHSGKAMMAPGMSTDVMRASHMGAPGGGVVQASHHGQVAVPPPPYGAVAAAGALQPGMHPPVMPKRTEVRFVGPDGTKVRWMVAGGPDGRPMASPQSLSVPGRYNFLQGAVYRLKLDIPREDLPALYPTLEVVPSNARTDAFLAHSAVPVAFTNEDFNQVKAGNYVTKVVYLPDPQFQDLATALPEEIISTRLEPGADPIAEAHRRGSILLVVRIGNIDLELQHSPPLMAPGVGSSAAPMMLPAEAQSPPPLPGTPTSRRAPATGVQQASHQTAQPLSTTPASMAGKQKSAATPPTGDNSGRRWWNFGK